MRQCVSRRAAGRRVASLPVAQPLAWAARKPEDARAEATGAAATEAATRHEGDDEGGGGEGEGRGEMAAGKCGGRRLVNQL